MSIGIDGFAQNSNCDANNANFQATQNVAAQLQAAGVAVVAAAGNSNLIGAELPGCLSSVFADRRDQRRRRPGWLHQLRRDHRLVGPGRQHRRRRPPGRTPHGTKRRHLDGGTARRGRLRAAARVRRRQRRPDHQRRGRSRLDATGVNVTDNGATRKRINVLDAATATGQQQRLRQRGDASCDPGAGVQRLRLQRLLGHRAGRAGAVQHRQRRLVELDAGRDRHGDHLHRGQRHQRHHVRHHAGRLHRQHARLH